MNSFINKTQGIAIVFVWLVGLLLGCTPSRPANRRDPTAITPAAIPCAADDGTGRSYWCVTVVNKVPMCATCNVPTENFGCNPSIHALNACCYEMDCGRK